MQRKPSQPWPSRLPSVFFCNEWIKQGAEKACCLVQQEAHQKPMVPVLALEKAAQYFIWSLPQGDPIPVPWKGWRDEHVQPTVPHGTTCVVLFCRGALFFNRWRAAGHPQKSHGSLLWGSFMRNLIFNTHTCCTPWGGTKLWMWAPPHRGSTEPPLCCKNKRVQNLLYKGLEMGGGGETEVSSHNILSQGVCQQTKQALWKQFSFPHCWIGLNLFCSYCLSLDLRIIGYETMKFCPNELCSDLQEEVHLYPLS